MALVSLASLLQKNGVQNAITFGDDAVVDDEEEILKWVPDTMCESVLSFTNIEPAQLEVGGDKKLNLWISQQIPAEANDTWQVIEVKTLQNIGLHQILTEFAVRPERSLEERKSVDSPVPPSPLLPPSQLPKDPQEAFISSLRHDKLLIPPRPPKDLYDADELLANMLKGSFHMFSSAAKKLAKLLPSLPPPQAPDTNPLETLLCDWQFPVVAAAGGVGAGQAEGLSKGVAELRESYDRAITALKFGLEGLERMGGQVGTRNPRVTFEMVSDGYGFQTVFLSNKTDTPVTDLTIRYLNAGGDIIQQFTGISVAPISTALCLESTYFQQWKDAGLSKIVLEGFGESIVIP